MSSATRRIPVCAARRHFGCTRAGFTLTEMLVAAALALLMMLAAVNIFGLIGTSVGNNRAYIELSGRLRSAQFRLQQDLRGATARMVPPLDPKDELGYFEIVEGPGPWVEIPIRDTVGNIIGYDTFALGPRPVKNSSEFDSSVGDVDDILMFTTRSDSDPFTGVWQGNPVQSQVAEVAWFMRGNKLYRRQLLVLPGLGSQPLPSAYYNINDVSVRREGGQRDYRTAWVSRNPQVTANSLGDLTKRENRFAHQPLQFPHDVRFWGSLGLPLMQETAHANFPLLENSPGSPDVIINIPGWPPASVPSNRDFWNAPMAGFPVTPVNDSDLRVPDALTTLAGGRATEDLILNNVIGFDVKVWDAAAPIFGHDDHPEPIRAEDPEYKRKLKNGASPIGIGTYVDLFYTRGTGADVDLSPFAGPGHPRSGLRATGNTPATYCTWSTHYENDGRNQADYILDGGGNPIVLIDEGTDGVGNDAIESETLPPYPVPLRGIQVKIRVFEPDNGQIREVTVIQDFIR